MIYWILTDFHRKKYLYQLLKIKEIHSSDYKFVIVSSGGGSNAIASLLEVPGASNSVLEVYIPYAKESLDFYLLKKPDFYCSKETALRMAAKAYSAAKKIDAESSRKKLLGVAITAALATNYKKRGDHKFHIALQTEDYSKSISCVLEKGARSRKEEEQLVTEYVVNLISESLGLDFRYPEIKEQSVIDRVEAKEGWQKLMREEISFITKEGQKPKKYKSLRRPSANRAINPEIMNKVFIFLTLFKKGLIKFAIK